VTLFMSPVGSGGNSRHVSPLNAGLPSMGSSASATSLRNKRFPENGETLLENRVDNKARSDILQVLRR
jgi:hypothetical protein